jgi:hypothetical protein
LTPGILPATLYTFNEKTKVRTRLWRIPETSWLLTDYSGKISEICIGHLFVGKPLKWRGPKPMHDMGFGPQSISI